MKAKETKYRIINGSVGPYNEGDVVVWGEEVDIDRLLSLGVIEQAEPDAPVAPAPSPALAPEPAPVVEV